MFTVVEIAGQQYKVSPASKLFVSRLPNEVGSTVTFDKILIYGDDKQVKVGTPTVKGMKVEAKVLGHEKDDTVIVFKKKKRKGYRLRKGHRQQYTQIEVTKIG